MSVRCILILLSLVACLLKSTCGIVLLSSSTIQSCVTNTSTASNSSLQCQQELVLTLTVASGEEIASDSLDLSISCISSPSGSCPCPCNYALDVGCACRDLTSPVAVTVTKSASALSYPLTYLQAFNYKPVEILLRPSNDICLDSAYDSQPTCGWSYVSGVRVPNSQGFCCECSSSDIWDDTFGTPDATRADLDCALSLGIAIGKVPVSASCLQFNASWFSGYLLGAATLQFDININVAWPASSANASAQSTNSITGNISSETLTISPFVPVALSKTKALSAQLLGDLASYTQPPAISNQVLLMPQMGSALDAFNTSLWLVLSQSQISFDGTQCNLVGTSFTGFQLQPDACSQPPQTCLSNQIADLLAADAQRISKGLPPLNMAERFTSGNIGQPLLNTFYGGNISFALPTTTSGSSVVVIRARADSLTLVTYVAPAVISAARLCTYASVQCGGFEAGASHGYLWANITSTGYVPSEYTLEVTNCSADVAPAPAQQISVGAQQTVTASPFEIYVQDAAAVSDRYCWLTLVNAEAEIVDHLQVFFYTNSTEWDVTPTGGVQGPGDGPGSGVPDNGCSANCPGVMDIACFFYHLCWTQIVSFFAIIVCIIVGLLLVGLAAYTGTLFPILKGLWTILSCFNCCYGCRVFKTEGGGHKRVHGKRGGGIEVHDLEGARMMMQGPMIMSAPPQMPEHVYAMGAPWIVTNPLYSANSNIPAAISHVKVLGTKPTGSKGR